MKDDLEILCQGHMMPHSYVHTAMQPLYTTEQGIIGDVGLCVPP